MAQPQTSPPPDPAFPDRNPRASLVFGALLCLALVSFGLAIRAFPGWIDSHRRGLPRYAAERALDALAAGDKDGAVRETKALLAERPFAPDFLEPNAPARDSLAAAPVLRNRVTAYNELAARLFSVGLPAEAGALAWKSIMEYHAAPRTLELSAPWNLLYHTRLAANDFASAYQCLRIMAALGEPRVPTPDRLHPIALPFDPAPLNQTLGIVPSNLSAVLKLLAEAGDPAVRANAASQLARLAAEAQNSVLKDAMLADARRAAGERSAPWPAAGDNALDLDLNAFVPVSTGWFPPAISPSVASGAIMFSQRSAAAEQFNAARAYSRLAIEFSATKALGIWPILAVAIDDRPPIPVYCDSDRPAVFLLDAALPAGARRIELSFLNEGAFVWGDPPINETRTLTIRRIGLFGP